MLNFSSLKNPLNRADSESRVLRCLTERCLTIAIYCISDRSVQLSTTDIFCRKNGKYSTIKYYVRKIKNPWILGKHEIQYFIVLYFPFFRQKLPVVLNCTFRSEMCRRSAAYSILRWNREHHEVSENRNKASEEC